MNALLVGDWVRSRGSGRRGVIKKIMTSELYKKNPYWVFWDNGRDDWYSGEYLVLDTQGE